MYCIRYTNDAYIHVLRHTVNTSTYNTQQYMHYNANMLRPPGISLHPHICTHISFLSEQFLMEDLEVETVLP